MIHHYNVFAMSVRYPDTAGGVIIGVGDSLHYLVLLQLQL